MPFDARLPCFFCRAKGEYHTFPDFGPLAAHVAREHFEDRQFLRSAILEVLENHPELEKLANEAAKNSPWFWEDEMLPSSGGNQPTQRKRTGVPFLTNDLLTKNPKEAKILMVKSDAENRFGASVLLKLALDGKQIIWTLRLKNPNYDLLIDQFGQDENDWIEKRINLFLEKDEFSEQWFPRVSFPPEAKPEPKKKS